MNLSCPLAIMISNTLTNYTAISLFFQNDQRDLVSCHVSWRVDRGIVTMVFSSPNRESYLYLSPAAYFVISLQCSHNERDGVSNQRRRDGSRHRLVRRRSKKTSKVRVTVVAIEIHRLTLKSPHKRLVTRKIFPFDDVIMPLQCSFFLSFLNESHNSHYSRLLMLRMSLYGPIATFFKMTESVLLNFAANVTKNIPRPL